MHPLRAVMKDGAITFDKISPPHKEEALAAAAAAAPAATLLEPSAPAKPQ